MTYSEVENIYRDLKLKDPKFPEVFHFDSTPYEEEFKEIFNFYSETLENFSDYGINPALIYFNNHRTKNAFACKRGGYFIVSFNCGTIIHLIQTFEKTTFITNRLDLNELLDTKVNKLMYQFCLHFTLYHEMAHLIQKSSYLPSGFNELHERIEPYDEKRHLFELDADKFSSLCLGAHICDYLEKLDKLWNNSELEEHVLVISVAALMVYILSFNSSNEELYFRKYHHPHPSIRLFNAVGHIIDYTFQARKGRSANKKERTQILINASKVVKNSTKSNTIITYVEILVNNYTEIKKYSDSFILHENKDVPLASDKWNEKVE